MIKFYSLIVPQKSDKREYFFEEGRMQKRKLTPFGLKVKNRLADMNMTQKELAKRLGTSDAYLSMILYGERAGTIYIASIKNILDIN